MEEVGKEHKAHIEQQMLKNFMQQPLPIIWTTLH